MTCWILVPEDDVDSLDFRCCCETWPAPAFYCPPHGQRAVSRPMLGIFSLFVPEQYRSCGYGHVRATA
jgi:hypothetical protein